MIRFFCPSGHRLKVADDMAGQQVRCSRCKEIVVVPERSTRPASKSSSPGNREGVEPVSGPGEQPPEQHPDHTAAGPEPPEPSKPGKQAKGDVFAEVVGELLGPTEKKPAPDEAPGPPAEVPPTGKPPKGDAFDEVMAGLLEPLEKHEPEPEPQKPAAQTPPPLELSPQAAKPDAEPPPLDRSEEAAGGDTEPPPLPGGMDEPGAKPPPRLPKKRPSVPPEKRVPALPVRSQEAKKEKPAPGPPPRKRESPHKAEKKGKPPAPPAKKGPPMPPAAKPRPPAPAAKPRPSAPKVKRPAALEKKPPPIPPEAAPESKAAGKAPPDEGKGRPSRRDRRASRDRRRSRRKLRAGQEAAREVPAAQPAAAKPTATEPAAARAAVEEPKHRRMRRKRAPAGPRLMPPDTYVADTSKRISVRWLALWLGMAVAFSAAPLVYGSHLNLEAAPWWARLVLLVAVLQAAYIGWMLSSPDWASVWVVMLVFAGVSMLYGMATAIAVATPQHRPMPLDMGEVRHSAKAWCSSVLLVMALATYLAGRTATRWRRMFELEMAARLRRR